MSNEYSRSAEETIPTEFCASAILSEHREASQIPIELLGSTKPRILSSKSLVKGTMLPFRD